MCCSGLILIWLFVLGAVLGSFLNVCVYRIPQHERLIDQLRGLVSPGSHCPRCKAPIRKTDNIPIIGWLRLKGRCRNCRGRISFRYPLIELLNGLLFVVVYWLELPHEFSTRAWESSHLVAFGAAFGGRPVRTFKCCICGISITWSSWKLCSWRA